MLKVHVDVGREHRRRDVSKGTEPEKERLLTVSKPQLKISLCAHLAPQTDINMNSE